MSARRGLPRRAGQQCNYYTCVDGELVGSAVGCARASIDQVDGGPFVCDPSLIARSATDAFTPPPSPCPLGGLWSIDPESESPFVQCVQVAQCQPLVCDPAFGSDGCPSDHACDSVTRTCIAAQ